MHFFYDMVDEFELQNQNSVFAETKKSISDIISMLFVQLTNNLKNICNALDFNSNF